MATYSGFTNRMNQVIHETVADVTWNHAFLWKWFNRMPGLVKQQPKGVIKSEGSILAEPEGAQIISDLSDTPVNTPKFTTFTSSMATLAVKLSVPKLTIDRWKNNTQVSFGLNDVIQSTLNKMTVQVDSFIGWGDEAQHMRTGDVNADEAKYKGLFNSGTEFSGGIGTDNNVTAKGDYMATLSNATLALKKAGYEVSMDPAMPGYGFYMFSDSDTAHAAKTGNNLWTDTFLQTEHDTVVEVGKKSEGLVDWYDSPNFANVDSDYFICVTNPYKNKPSAQRQSTAYRLLQGYNFDIEPVNGGQLGSNGRYEWFIIWSGGFEVEDATSIQVTGETEGTLTLA